MIEILLRLKAIIAIISALILTLAPVTPSFDIVLGNAVQTKKDWNSTSIIKGDEITATFHVKWVNWLDASGWKPIDTKFATSYI